jgi:hypothetical protein
VGSSRSVSAVGHGSQISNMEVWTVAYGGHGRWPVSADEPVVFIVDVTAMGHSTSESTSSARNHRFLLNNRECVTVPYQAHQLLVFCKPD